MDPVVTATVSIAVWALTGGLGAMVGYFATRLRSKSRHEEAMEKGMQCLLRNEIVDAYDMYVHEKRPMSVEKHREISEAYQAYHDLGGNGVITDMYEKLMDTDKYVMR